MDDTNQLLRELIQETKAIREYFQQAETRIILTNLAEAELDHSYGRHVQFLRQHIKRFYLQAKKQKKQHVIDAIDKAPYRILPDDDDE